MLKSVLAPQHTRYTCARSIYLARGERPIHYGENFVDSPENVLGIFAAHALLADPDRRPAVAADVDIPWCAGDLFSIEKLALALGRP